TGVQLIYAFRRPVGGSVVDDDQFPVREGLVPYAFDRAGYRVGSVVRRQNDGNVGHARCYFLFTRSIEVKDGRTAEHRIRKLSSRGQPEMGLGILGAFLGLLRRRRRPFGFEGARRNSALGVARITRQITSRRFFAHARRGRLGCRRRRLFAHTSPKNAEATQGEKRY